jgi:integrase
MTTKQFAPAMGAQATPRPAHHGLTFRELADGYMAAYRGRDPSRVNHLAWWVARFGDRLAQEITDDEVFLALEDVAAGESRYYAGKDASGERVYRSRGKRSPATINRYHACVGAVFTYAQRKRLMPKGWTSPARQVARQRENNERVRFLSDAERARLLKLCRVSSWPRLYLLVLLALTTGARRSELLRLRWRDLDLERAVAYVAQTKNGQPKALPLVPAAVKELQRFLGAADRLVFESTRRPGKPMIFDSYWDTALAEAKVEDFRFHDLRHTCASYLAQNGASLLEIADVLGHKNLSVTRRYSHLTIDSKSKLVNRVLGGMQ